MWKINGQNFHVYDLKDLVFIGKNSSFWSSLPVRVTMADSVKLFYTIRKCYVTTGLYSIQSNQIPPFNSKIFIFLLFNTLYFASACAYVLFCANTIQEYGVSTFIFLTNLTVLILFVLTILRMPQILKLMEMCETFIEQRRSTVLQILICDIFFDICLKIITK